MADGLYRLKGRFELNRANDGQIRSSSTVLGCMNLIGADGNSDYFGKMYLDDIAFSQ